LNQALDMIRRHNSSLVFVCEPGLTRAMMGIGRTAEEARTCDINGCYEYNVRAREVKTAPIYLNLLKPIELVFHDGVDPVSGIKIGLHTGTQFTTFDDFYQAYIRQLEHVLDDGLHCVDSFEPYLMEINPTPLFSATITHSLETAKDAFANGSQYNNTILLHTGLATTVDALMAVKQLVYEQHTVTLAEMKAALDANWNGYALLRQKALRTPEKFGCHTPASDRYAQAIARFTSTKVNLRPNVRGGFYKAAMHSARTFITFGAQCGATPDGRLAGEEMSKNLSPTMGMDTRGVTALIESAIGVDSAQFPEDYCLDVMLHPATTQGTDGLTAMRALLTTYMRGNGVALHFNVFDPATLEDAQQHPEKYRGLQVRVCGWNVLFSNLCRKEQDAYILRARNITQS
ncbi:MAG: pyruvate formate lyase family protein, partial [Clostridia bacterium]